MDNSTKTPFLEDITEQTEWTGPTKVCNGCGHELAADYFEPNKVKCYLCDVDEPFGDGPQQ